MVPANRRSGPPAISRTNSVEQAGGATSVGSGSRVSFEQPLGATTSANFGQSGAIIAVGDRGGQSDIYGTRPAAVVPAGTAVAVDSTQPDRRISRYRPT